MSANITPGEMSEWCLFLMGLHAYEETGIATEKNLQRAQKLVRAGASNIEEGFEKYFTPLVGGNPLFARFKGPLRQAMVGNAIVAASKKGLFLTTFLPALRPKKDIVLGTFADSRAAQAIQKGALAASEADPRARLQKIAVVPTASRLPMHRKWLRKVAEEVGAGSDVAEEVLSDAETAQTIGEELRQNDARILQVDPLTEEGADLQSVKQDIIDRLDTVAEDSEFPQTVFSAAATAAAQPKEYLTSTGRDRKLLPDKEAAMMIRGRGVIAAGAGAGKTLTLASKVVYHIKELGVPTSAVVATSFSRKSAAELRQRIEKYGADLGDDRATGGFGTTHKVAGRLMRDYGGRSRKAIKDSGQNTLVRLAMEQVQMPGGGSPPEAVGFFTGLDGSVPSQADVDSPDSAPGIGLTFEQALTQAADRRKDLQWNNFLYDYLRGFFDSSDKWHSFKMRASKNLTDPRGFNDKNKDIIDQIFGHLKVDYDIWNPENKDPNLSGSARTAAKKDKDKGLRERYDFFSKPAGEWFNLGRKLTQGEEDQETPIPLGEFKQAISKLKGKAISPSEAWHMDSVDKNHAAVYAAYEWLKGPRGETDFQNGGDFDDLLLDVSKMMMSDPRARNAIQSRFKVVLVDEAQDLNRAQHVMFGLMTGYLDPAKVPNVASVDRVSEMARDDGNMTADTYVFIGDDKQAIYEFRGADPEAFIDMSDLVEDGAGFATHILETNYRSGKNIVEAANQLISHNPKQIPMVCKANPERMDEGGVKVVTFPPTNGRDFSEAAEWVADHIEEAMESMAEGSDAPGYDAFGIGLRTRAEGMAYGVELIKKGMPFRSKINFFKDYTTKALLAWLTIADEGVDGNPDRINAAVLEATGSPKSNLGKAFQKRVAENATGNYISWLGANGSSIYGPRSKWSSYVQAFTDNLRTIAALKGTGLTADETLSEIFELTGYDGTNIKDSLIEKVRNNGERMAELMATSANGAVTEEDMEAEAFAPISPLKGLLESRGDLEQALSYVRTLEEANKKLATNDDPSDAQTPAITLGTMHGWKGLEVPNMIIPMVGGRFPRFDKTDPDEMASERRLAYVAITRGEDNVYVLDIPTARDTKQGIVITQSPFVNEMCVPQLDSEGKIAKLTEEELLQLSEEEMAEAEVELDSEIEAYLASPEAMTPDRKLLASWGGLLYTKKRNP